MVKPSEKHNHEECRHLLGSLSDYVDGDLEERLCAEIERHLVECENCRVVVDTLKKTVYLYHVTSEPQPVPKEVKERLYKRLNLGDLLDG
jgi:predicted anti-sigma-YlaC factor YlaD